MPVKKVIGNLLRRRGYHVFRDIDVAQANLSLHLQRLFQSQGVDCVFDIGANRGQYAGFLRRAIGFAGLIVSIEPVAALAEDLRARAHRETKWVVLNCALGRTAGHANFNVMKGDQLSSFLKPTTAASDRFRDSNTVTAVQDTEIRRLDDVFYEVRQQFGFMRHYVKIDTQGYDLEVAAGGAECLAGSVGLQTEGSNLPLYEGAPQLQDSIRFFSAQGFSLSWLSPINVDQRLKLLDCDCVFVNPSQIQPTAIERY